MKILKNKLPIALVITLILFSILLVVLINISPPKTPDFAKIATTEMRKNAFFNYLLPKIKHSNAQITQLRQQIINQKLSEAQLNALIKRYKLPAGATQKDFLNKIDIVPISLVLAQAAIESSWGRSRFAKHANNFFGIWCFTKGCGMVPLRRNQGAVHEVKTFASPAAAITYYMYTINHNQTYALLRKIRQYKRDHDILITGISLSEGLAQYSEMGYEYVEVIQNVIRHNNLARYDLP